MAFQLQVCLEARKKPQFCLIDRMERLDRKRAPRLSDYGLYNKGTAAAAANYILFHALVLFWIFQVRIVLEGVDKNNNLIGSVYYPDGDSAKDLSLDLVKNVSTFVHALQFGIRLSSFC